MLSMAQASCYKLVRLCSKITIKGQQFVALLGLFAGSFLGRGQLPCIQRQLQEVITSEVTIHLI